MTKACIDVKSEPRGAYRIGVDEADGTWIKTFGDYDPEVYRGYMGKETSDKVGFLLEILDRMPEGSAINVGEDRTEVFNRDRSTAVLPIGLADFETTLSVLQNIVKEPESAGILDLSGVSQ